jgi:hypothetical protein
LKASSAKPSSVEQADRLQFVARFQAGFQHPGLDRQRHQQQHVVARQAQHAGARHQQHGAEEQAGEQAGARLFYAEHQEFGAEAAPSGQRTAARVEQQGVEGGQRRKGVVMGILGGIG